MNSTDGPSPDHAIKVVAVIGAGQAGRTFALACAEAGFYVVIEDVMPSNLRKAETEYSDLSLQGGYGALELASTVEGAVREADVVVDFVPDELESKLEIFSLVDRMAPPKTILCTPSTALSITDLASCVYRPDRCVAIRGQVVRGASVQVIHPPEADAIVLESISAMLRRLGVSPVSIPDPDASMLTGRRM